MSHTCPRCSTNVPEEALYCPYCNLPKPKSGPARPAKQSVEKRVQSESKSAAKSAMSRASTGTKRPARKLRLPVVIAGAFVAFLGVGAYIYVLPLIRADRAEPKLALSTLDKFRRMPSNDPSLTVDARLNRELERSRKAGELVAFQGWTARGVKGNKSRVLLSFSYQESGGVHQRAEWIADLANNTFTPQTALAAAIYGKL